MGLLCVSIYMSFIGWPSVPLFAFAACSLLGASISFLLKETKGQPMIEEINKPGRKLSIISIVAANLRRLSTGGGDLKH